MKQIQFSLIMLLTLGATNAFAQAPQLVKNPPGLKVGEKAPNFVLMDQKGEKQSLEAMLKKKRVAIVFYRSGSW